MVLISLSTGVSGGTADAHGSGPCTRKGVGVQIPSRALVKYMSPNNLLNSACWHHSDNECGPDDRYDYRQQYGRELTLGKDLLRQRDAAKDE